MLPEKQPRTSHPLCDSHDHISFITVTPNSAQHIRKKGQGYERKREINNYPAEAVELRETWEVRSEPNSLPAAVLGIKYLLYKL